MKTNNDTGNNEITDDDNSETDKLPDNDNADGRGDINKAVEQKEEWDTLNRNGISPKPGELDEDIKNDIEKTEVIPHVKKRHPLNGNPNNQDIKWQEKDQQESDYEKQSDDDDNFAGGL